MIRLEMKNCNTILTEKQQKYQHYHLKKLINNQRQIIKQANFSYFLLGKAFKKQIKTIEDRGEKQIKVLEEHGKELIKSSSEKDSLFKTKRNF